MSQIDNYLKGQTTSKKWQKNKQGAEGLDKKRQIMATTMKTATTNMKKSIAALVSIIAQTADYEYPISILQSIITNYNLILK